jgi:hypothetical protein
LFLKRCFLLFSLVEGGKEGENTRGGERENARAFCVCVVLKRGRIPLF